MPPATSGEPSAPIGPAPDSGPGYHPAHPPAPAPGWPAGHRHPAADGTAPVAPDCPARGLAVRHGHAGWPGQSRFRADIAVTDAAAGRAPAPAESRLSGAAAAAPQPARPAAHH